MGISKYREIFQRLSGKGVYPHELAFLLDNPVRNLILSPGKLCGRLHITESSTVLEVGPGPGYFSLEAARRLRKGKLFLFDIQSEMLKKNRRKLSAEGLNNFYPAAGNAGLMPFKAGQFDVVFMVTVLGEVVCITDCLHCCNYALKPGGILSLTEMKGDPDALSKEEILRMAEKCGFRFMEEFISFAGFTINLKKA